ncbi:MAG: GDP-mannose 4,6-dehydratase [Euryarchaeota archaeon]|nr:GDP-mannose 4,6-dehydratase [Euryarchaeota archaeon]
MKVIVTGGAGFVGSHASEWFARAGHHVVALDNLSRGQLLHQKGDFSHNWNHLKNVQGVELRSCDITDWKSLSEATRDADVIIHTAAQTAVTASLTDPRRDFEVNAFGSFNVMEAARENDAGVVYCSTNKVYGDNVNKVGVVDQGKRYAFEPAFKHGIPETFNTDHCEHTPYGTSKLTGDLYAQDYAHTYGLKTGVFRMSCIYGTRQLGVEDQGWVAWFTIATLSGRPITIFGDGKQVRDTLFVEDLVAAWDAFLKSNKRHGVYNTGGGAAHTTSLLELLDVLEEKTGKRSKLSYADWRPSDQKVYVSDTRKLKDELGWSPKVALPQGLDRMLAWFETNKKLIGAV